jgi:hypothetical protein
MTSPPAPAPAPPASSATPVRPEDAELTIGELAARFGLATHVLRHWETKGLLSPARRVAGRRRALLREQLAVLDRRIAAAQASRHLIAHALDCTAEDLRQCPNFLRMVNARIPDRPDQPDQPAARGGEPC